MQITEGVDGTWSCSLAGHELDEHDTLVDALVHLHEEAEHLYDEPELWVQFADGVVEELAAVPFFPLP